MTDQRNRRVADTAGVLAPAITADPELEGHIAFDRVEILFQPQFNLASGRIVGVEALARLPGSDDARGLFARAAAAGLAERLSHMVQRKALRLAGAWAGALGELGISINFLPEDIGRAGFADALLGEIAVAEIDPSRVTVEITENSLIADDPRVAARLDKLRGAGVKIAVDDFGTGYASLFYLSALPLDELKIDRGLIDGIEHGESARVIVRAIIGLARDLNLELIIEGVETAAQLALLSDWGCTLYQGFLGARPMSEKALEHFVAAHQERCSSGLERPAT
jgi:EAL domain-containing protein (putative c-di-GMP-specific phosphodiesterase class I)